VLNDVPASINGGDLFSPLLGMSVLRRLNMTVAGGTMTLRG
jgi:predicted aspartyl protease